MTMCYIRISVAILLFFFGLNFSLAQENLTGYLQPQIAINYKISGNYFHNFSLAQRNYIYDESNLQLETRQLDLAHFSKWKIQDNQSLSIGIQYRFSENFESSEHNELRFIQQHNITSKPRNVRFGHRVRSEQRITSLLTIHRFRYRFAIDFPLNGENLDVGEPYLVASAESLWSIAKSNKPEFDQRFSGNIGWQLKEKTKLQLGIEYRTENHFQEIENVLFLNTNLVLSL